MKRAGTTSCIPEMRSGHSLSIKGSVQNHYLSSVRSFLYDLMILYDSLCQLLTGQHLICLQVFLDRLVYNLLWKRPVIARIRLQPVTCELLVKGRLSMSRLIALCRPETGAVRCEHLVAKHDVAIFIQSEFKFCVRNDNAASKCIFRTFFIKSNRVVTDLLRIFSAFSRIIFFQMRNTLLKGNIFIVISDLSLCGRRIDRLRQLVRLLQPLRKADAADRYRSP